MTTFNKVKASSDHNLIGAILRTKDRKVQEQEVLRRDRKHMGHYKIQRKY